MWDATSLVGIGVSFIGNVATAGGALSLAGQSSASLTLASADANVAYVGAATAAFGTCTAHLLTCGVHAGRSGLVRRSVGAAGFAALYEAASLSMTGGNITGSMSVTEGGAMWVGGAARLTLASVLMSTNRAGGFGGVIHANTFAVVEVTACMFVDNAAQQGGGAVHVHFGVAPPGGPQQVKFTITDSYAAFNRCNGAGGFVELVTPRLGGGPLVSLVRTTVEANLGVTGGGVVVLGADARIEHIPVPTAQRCDADASSHAYSGGVPVPTPSTGIYLEGCLIRGNSAGGGSGGGLIAAGIGTTLVARCTRVEGHVLGGTGAGIYLQSYARAILQAVECTGNVATLGACLGVSSGARGVPPVCVHVH